MSKKKKQTRLFFDAAKKHEAEMEESVFEKAVQQIAKPQPIKPKNENGNPQK